MSPQEPGSELKRDKSHPGDSFPSVLQYCGKSLFSKHSFHPTSVRGIYFRAILMLNLVMQLALTAEILPDVVLVMCLGMWACPLASLPLPWEKLVSGSYCGFSLGPRMKTHESNPEPNPHRSHPSWTCSLKQSHPQEPGFDTLTPRWAAVGWEETNDSFLSHCILGGSLLHSTFVANHISEQPSKKLAQQIRVIATEKKDYYQNLSSRSFSFLRGHSPTVKFSLLHNCLDASHFPFSISS